MGNRYPKFPQQNLGFTLVEILIALVIGLFLMGALLTIVQANRTAFGNQNQLAQLQDSERMAMTMMTDVIQSAGYFPQPWNNTLAGSLTATGPFAVGQSVYGVYAPGAPGDSISVRYMTMGQDGILNCSGQSNSAPSGTNTLYVNTFQVMTPPGSTTSQLVCTMNGTQYDLVNGVAQLSILYGVKANAGASGNSVDTYMNADQVTAATLWGGVISVLVQLTFNNPMYVASQPTTPVNQPTVSLQRVIGVMNQTGPMQ
jgi:type IV pilus assembly protein PilW